MLGCQVSSAIMSSAVLPQKNTFLHFQEQEHGLPEALDRSASLPGTWMPLKKTSSMPADNKFHWNSTLPVPDRPAPVDIQEDLSTLSTWSDDEEEDLSTVGMRRTDSTNTVYAWPLYQMRSMALPIPAVSCNDARHSSFKSFSRSDSCTSSPKRMCRTLRTESECRERLIDALEDEETSPGSAYLSDDSESPIDHTHCQGKKRWADLSEDECTPAHQEASLQGKKRWADLSEDEQTPIHQEEINSFFDGQGFSARSEQSSENEEEWKEKQKACDSIGGWTQVKKQGMRRARQVAARKIEGHISSHPSLTR